MDMNSSVLFMLKDGFSTSKESINCSHYEYNIPALLFMALIFHKISSTGGNSRFYFHKVSKAASKTLKLWVFHNFIFTKSLKFVKL